MINKLDKIADPVSHYKKPIDVDKDEQLSRPEKITALENWMDDIQLRHTAEAENMASSDDRRYRLAEIQRLLSLYRQETN